ncbi:VOC family protein [Pseudonocardia sp. KRD291]|uniref:VOC family protein n=1 Tax=Pseudonocardia sp. KRD291 TaxID=2792007 RepID=UPI001C49E05B|nr:VOC family protein [Pseudonocardia sp. KRD291]MBW0102282.1 VOC family protein [Pseudonocardia sp. KRD291]
MTSRVLAVAVDALDAESLAAFWRSVLGGTVDRWSDARGVRYVELAVPGGGPSVLFQSVSEPRPGKNRVHLDVAPKTGEQADEVARVVALGATVLGDEPDLPWVVLADPEGNEFCILPPRALGDGA